MGNESMKKGKPTAQEILKAQIKKRAQRNQLIHREFGDFAYRALSKKHNALVEKLSDGQEVSAREMDEITDQIVAVDVSDPGHREFLRSALSFWSFKMSEKFISRRPYFMYKKIQPLEKMMK